MPHHEQKTKVPGDSAAKTRGTVVAARVRAKANKFTDEQRKDLVEQGMAIIYGGVKHAKSSLNRG